MHVAHAAHDNEESHAYGPPEAHMMPKSAPLAPPMNSRFKYQYPRPIRQGQAQQTKFPQVNDLLSLEPTPLDSDNFEGESCALGIWSLSSIHKFCGELSEGLVESGIIFLDDSQ